MPSTFARLQEDLNRGRIDELWTFETKSWITSVHAADIDRDGDIEVLAGSRDGRVYALTKSGDELWSNVLGTKAWVNSVVSFSFQFDPQATSASTYVVAGARDGKIYVLNKDGNLVGKDGKVLEKKVPASSEDGTNAALLPQQYHWFDAHHAITRLHASSSSPLDIVFCAEDRTAYGFNLALGKPSWHFHADSHIKAVFTSDINRDGCLETLIGSDDHQLTLLSSSGLPYARRQMDQAVYALFAADIDRDNAVEILVGTRSRRLFALDADLNEKWSVKLSSRPLALFVADMNNDQQGEILVACDDQCFYVLDHTGKQLWRQRLGARFYSLSALDLDRDGSLEVLAGGDDNAVSVLSVELVKDLEKKIRRDYRELGKPDPETLLSLRDEQRGLLRDILGLESSPFDRALSFESTQALLAEVDETSMTEVDQRKATEALRSLVKLSLQRFQFLWEKEPIGYLNTLCLVGLTGSQRAIVVGGPTKGVQAFSPSGRLLWSHTANDEYVIDAQTGYIYREKGEGLAFLSSAGHLFLLNNERKREITSFPFQEPISCFSLQASDPLGPIDLLVGTESGKACLYTNDLTSPAQNFVLPAAVQLVYVSAPYNGLYRSPEILINTADNQVLAYNRGGNCLWSYKALDRVLAINTRDIDNDGRLEVLIATDDYNIHVLDHLGNHRWRYVFSHSVQALDVVDLDGDGELEILVGCADGLLAVFKNTGDLIWRYQGQDCIQALRVADIDQDGHYEIAIVSEGRLEVLQVIERAELASLIDKCWSYLLSTNSPLKMLGDLIEKDPGPYLRGAALRRLAQLYPHSGETLELLREAAYDGSADDMKLKDLPETVLKALPKAVIYAYPIASPDDESVKLARRMLFALFAHRNRDVRIEVIENLELLALSNWSAVEFYLQKALDVTDRKARRGAIRKIAHLIRNLDQLDAATAQGQTEKLFHLLLQAAQIRPLEWSRSDWIAEEAGRVLADLLNLSPLDFLEYFYRIITHELRPSELALTYTASNLKSSEAQRAFMSLVDLCFGFNAHNALTRLTRAAEALEAVQDVSRGRDSWLMCRELRDLFALQTLEELATYEFHLKPDRFVETDVGQAFVRLGKSLNAIVRSIKTYLRRENPDERLRCLLDGIRAVEELQSLVQMEYEAPRENVPLPTLIPAIIALKVLLVCWLEILERHLKELRGPARLICVLQSRQVHFEETVGIWLQVTNNGRSTATNVKVTLLPGERFDVLRPTFETDALSPYQDITAEFIIKPRMKSAALTLTFEVFYDGAEHASLTETTQERLDFLEWPREFTKIDNPYTTGTPIRDKRMCYGREEDLAYLQDNLTRTTAQTVLVLYGQRRSGKTTLLYQLANSPALAPHVSVLIDLQSLTYGLTPGNFFFKIAHAIYKELRSQGLCPPSLERAEFVGQAGVPADPQFAFDCFLDEVEPLLHERKLILLLDEFEMLEEQVKKGKLQPEIFEYLRSLMQRREYMHFLLAGLHHIEKLTREYWSVFFNIAFHYLLPSHITQTGAEALISEPVQGSLEYDPLAVEKIRRLTADQPYLIHLVCRSLVDHCNRQQKNYATLNDVNKVLNEVMDTGKIHFYWLWELINPFAQILLLIIAGESRDETRQFSVDELIEIYQQRGIACSRDGLILALKALLAEDVIEMNEGESRENVFENARYHISIGLLRQWLKRENYMRQIKEILEKQKEKEEEEQSMKKEQKGMDRANGALEVRSAAHAAD